MTCWGDTVSLQHIVYHCQKLEKPLKTSLLRIKFSIWCKFLSQLSFDLEKLTLESMIISYQQCTCNILKLLCYACFKKCFFLIQVEKLKTFYGRIIGFHRAVLDCHCFRVLGILEIGCYLFISLHKISRTGHMEDLSFLKYPVKYIGVQIFWTPLSVTEVKIPKCCWMFLQLET